MPEPKRCSCREKHTLRAQEEKKKLLNRLRRIEGQVRGLQAMVEADAYCNDVLPQSAAVNDAINAQQLLNVESGTLTISAADDAIHSDLVLNIGGDGTDGPTDAAGGYADGEAAAALAAKGLDAFAVLHENDAYHALGAVGGLIKTGATGTNVS